MVRFITAMRAVGHQMKRSISWSFSSARSTGL
jgi:hypothetical protein